MSRSYPSKLLLLGEYTIIKGASALAMPYPRYCTTWSDGPLPEEFSGTSLPKMGSQAALQQILAHIRQLEHPRLDLPRLEQELEEGLWLLSNAPIGYGLGSSGTVCAALYDRYALDKTTDLVDLQQALAQLEHSFHGKSSGIDPLVSYLNQAIQVRPSKAIEPVDLPPELSGVVFLVDTQHPRVSTPLITFFMEQCEQPHFEHNFLAPAAEAVEVALAAWLQNDFTTLYEAVRRIAALQLAHLPPMVLPQWQSIWQKGLDTGDYCLKLCGAGGGGFWLGFAPNWELVLQHFEADQVQRVF